MTASHTHMHTSWLLVWPRLGEHAMMKACSGIAGGTWACDATPRLCSPLQVDNTCMQLASKPNQFDVMVTPNL